MKRQLEIVAMGMAFIAVVSVMIWLTVYKWQDCRKVGHSVLYCVMDVAG
jgi:hypothetical protein